MNWVIASVVAVLLGLSSAFDGYTTALSLSRGNIEIGPGKLIFGQKPTKQALLLKGGAVILAEIVLNYLLQVRLTGGSWTGRFVFGAPFILQSVLHTVFAIQNYKLYKASK